MGYDFVGKRINEVEVPSDEENESNNDEYSEDESDMEKKGQFANRTLQGRAEEIYDSLQSFFNESTLQQENWNLLAHDPSSYANMARKTKDQDARKSLENEQLGDSVDTNEAFDESNTRVQHYDEMDRL